ncbi:MAG: hemolysin [Enterovirga sp.]|nr:hemolysin [Enterovirga sp.]
MIKLAEPARQRADALLVARGLFESRARAQEAIAAGLVRASGTTVRKPSEMIPAGSDLEASPPHPWVSRGGVKLAHALDSFGIDPAGLVCLDVGASTGGFTDVLLSRGAQSVCAVDVGQGQLHPRIAADARVRAFEKTDARRIDRSIVPEAVDLVVVDVSFISLRLVLPTLIPLVKTGGYVVALVKPQFEAGRNHLARGGIVRDEAVRGDALRGIEQVLVELGCGLIGSCPSPIAGGDGNREFLVGARRG